MAIAVSLWFDLALEKSVRTIWRALADDGVSSDLADGPYRPHVTIGAWESAHVEALTATLRTQSRAIAPVALRFAATRVFEEPGPVVYLEPTSAGLAALHARVHELVAPHVSDPLPFTRQGEWTPHCTMAWRLRDRALVEPARRVADAHLPLSGEGVALGVVDTPAEVELARVPLSPMPDASGR